MKPKAAETTWKEFVAGEGQPHFPSNQWQEKTTEPQAMLGKVQVGHQQEFIHGKGY